MAEPRSPSVPIEEAPFPRRISRAEASVVAFVGPAPRGPIEAPVRVARLDDYVALFGAARGGADPTGEALTAFFANGGAEAWVMRVRRPGAEAYARLFDRPPDELERANILVLPGQSMPRTGAGNGAIAAAVGHAERTGRAMVLIDPDPDAVLRSPGDVAKLALPASAQAVLYYPWLTVRRPGSRRAVAAAPSGFVAGVWARTDRTRGVWTAPAGVGATLAGAAGLRHAAGARDAAMLSPLGVNLLRDLPRIGLAIWGARTLAAQDHGVAARRTAMLIGDSLAAGLRWAVFEPNDRALWDALRRAAEEFLAGLWRDGALRGATPAEAFFVRCGPGATMTQADLDRGEAVVQVGFALLKPAEFAILRIGQTTGAAAAGRPARRRRPRA